MINYDLVLMDCMMPQLDGYEATALIRDPESGVLNNSVPIVAMTANATEEDRQKCLNSGMDDFLSKPVRKEALAEMISKWVERESSTHPPDKENEGPGCSPFFDERDLLDRLDNDRTFIRAILNQSLGEMPQQLALLQELSHGTDVLSISRQAQSMKGTAANISALALAEICFKVQSAAEEGDLAKTVGLMAELNHTVEQTVEAIKQAI
jgi:DNA-binding response OmpR family regulator